ncbi:Phenylacetic acid catabolic protein [Amaricoccus sp.]|uniref:Phenylacetic acid catabolic protein n=1 Tax=Amaricoccus sp. TaxID=1872485 RepID=UPI0026135DAD|nr:Phenylacetic acid catabolic protein [Amaricoccus sp.]HRO10223.1 phenylacetate-CoA oxygenase subunit PaaI [Amaricoccus sp.]
MSEDTATMPIEDYLAQGGQLTSPANVPSRYRGELLRLMASFVDSELAASAGFADTINTAPSITARIAACRITLEKADHAERVLKLMGDFGADEGRYATQHPWAARLPRDAALGQARHGNDMRLAVFHYPIEGWADAVVMNVLQGLAAGVTLEEMSKVSYAPLADVFRDIAPREKRHTDLGLTGLADLVAGEEGRAAAAAAVAYWQPKVAESFGTMNSARFETQKRFGLRHRPNEALLADWTARVREALAPLGLA